MTNPTTLLLQKGLFLAQHCIKAAKSTLHRHFLLLQVMNLIVYFKVSAVSNCTDKRQSDQIYSLE